MIRRLRSDDAGLTVVEMLVVVGILGTVLGIVGTGMVFTQRSVTDNASRLSGISQSNVSVEAMTRVLRTAVLPSQVQATCIGCDVAAFISADDYEVSFYANVDNDGASPSPGVNVLGPRKVTYWVDNNLVLWESIQKPNPHGPTDYNYQYCTPGPSCPVATRRLAADVLTTGTSPLFTYYDRTGAVLPTPLSAAHLKTVDSIDLLLRVKAAGRVGTTTVTARVTLPNADSLIQPTATP